MCVEEIISLDAKLIEMLKVNVFSAELANGHRIVVYAKKEEEKEYLSRLNLGCSVKVNMSPFDMSSGYISL